jgi:sialic acid synthase SpsE
MMKKDYVEIECVDSGSVSIQKIIIKCARTITYARKENCITIKDYNSNKDLVIIAEFSPTNFDSAKKIIEAAQDEDLIMCKSSY